MKDVEIERMMDALKNDQGNSQAPKAVTESADFIALKETWDELGELPPITPPSGMNKRFYNQLEAYAQGQLDRKLEMSETRKPSFLDQLRYWLWPVLAAACLGIGLFLGRQPQSLDSLPANPVEPQVDLVGLMAQSPAERLSVLQKSRTLENPDQRVLQALLHVLRTDESVTVRIGAVDALSSFGNNELVREGLVRALPMQNSPMVQIALIDALTKTRDDAALDSLEHLLQVETVNPIVRQHASDSLEAWR